MLASVKKSISLTLKLLYFTLRLLVFPLDAAA
jgi:hypothetical protein